MEKLKSAKLWITIWASALVTYIVISQAEGFMPLALSLSAVPLGYLGVNVYQKKIFSERESKEDKCVAED